MIAAMDLEMLGIGTDIDRDYLDDATRRLDSHSKIKAELAENLVAFLPLG